MEHFWDTLSVKKFGPLLCEQWSVGTWHVWFCEVFLVKLHYEQNLDDDNDRRGQSETL